MRRFAIEIDVRRPLMEFSTAIQQMVAIARAVSFKARLVIMDEPTSSLDEREVAVLFEVMRHLRAEGVAVIFITHRLDELYQVCDRVTVMRDGRTVSTSRMADVDKLHLISAMLGRDLEMVRERSTGFSHSARLVGEQVMTANGLQIGRKVRDARVEVRAGEIVGLAGLLGSGRTEVARAIFGADPAPGRNDPADGTRSLAARTGRGDRAGVGYCSEDRKADGIVPDMSVRENITLGILPRLIDAGRGRRGAPARDRRSLHGAPGDQGRQRRAEGARAFRRQPAEGAARPLACMDPKLLIWMSRRAASTSAPRPKFSR